MIEGLPKGRFSKIIFENVGTTFSHIEWGTPRARGWKLAKAYKDLLKERGEIRFQSFRFILGGTYKYDDIEGSEIANLIKTDPV